MLGSLLFVVSQNDLPAASPTEGAGQSIVYVDDDTEQECDADPVRLQEKLQCRVDQVTGWLADNRMVLAPKKTKLVLSTTPELRAARYSNLNLTIKVGGMTIYPTCSEKLLGVIISSDMSWDKHLWGETWRDSKNWPGVIPQLIGRLGLLKHLSKLSSKQKLRSFVPAMFTSKLLYALPLVGRMWGLSGYTEHEPHKYAFTLAHLSKLQSLQRQAALLLLPPDPTVSNIPTYDLLAQHKWLSVHQLIAFSTLSLAVRIIQTGKPGYLAALMSPAPDSRTRQNTLHVPTFRLSASLEGFINQACRLYNMLSEKLKCERDKERLKSNLKSWISSNITSKK